MPIPSPQLDDRSFAQLLAQAKDVVRRSCPQWTDLSVGDPGVALIEVFAYLTDTLIYRLNRLPDKAYVEFLRLIGVRVQPPAAAAADLVFTAAKPVERAVRIPRGTRVTTQRPPSGAAGESGAAEAPPVFVTAADATIAVGQTSATQSAYHGERVSAEQLGVGTGRPGLSLTARRPPIVAPTGDDQDLLVAVEAAPGELDERVPALQHDGRPFRIWREVEHFTGLGADRFVYVVDRVTGTITFAPAADLRPGESSNGGGGGGREEAGVAPLAEVPQADRRILCWYLRGGGAAGNVAAGTLTLLKDPIPGLSVTNPAAATGGRPAETLENALVRGPKELRSLDRAVTADDFELIALRHGQAVGRAKAFTRAALWAHAEPGTVEVLLVPYVLEDRRGGGAATAELLRSLETPDARRRIQAALDARRPLGTRALVNWVKYKTVRVAARVVVHRGESPDAVRARVLERLHESINPLPTGQFSGWAFGRSLRTFNVYDVVGSEPGVSYVDRVSLRVDEVPDAGVSSVAADAHQPRTWYAAAGPTLFRSLNDAAGWEPAGRFPGERTDLIRPHPSRPGLVALATGDENAPMVGTGNRVYFSHDCGETWQAVAGTAFVIEDMAWTVRDGVPVLLLATAKGLYELPDQPGAVPTQVLVDEGQQDRAFYAVAAGEARGAANVAVAGRGLAGVWLSGRGGQGRSFRHVGLNNCDIRALEVQHDGPQAFLWAGSYAQKNGPGTGCFRRELIGGEDDPPDGWRAFTAGWTGGSCRGLAFHGTRVIAGTTRAGVLWADSAAAAPQWQAPAFQCGLPQKQSGQLQPVDTLAARSASTAGSVAGPGDGLILAGGIKGVFLSRDGGAGYDEVSRRDFVEHAVTVPETWLFCSGAHEISVVGEDEAAADT